MPARVRADVVELRPALGGVHRIEQWCGGGGILPRPRPERGKSGRLYPARPAPPRPAHDPLGNPAAPAGALRASRARPSAALTRAAGLRMRAGRRSCPLQARRCALRTAHCALGGRGASHTARRPASCAPAAAFCARRSADQHAPIQREAPTGPRGGPISPRSGGTSLAAPPQRPEHAPCGIRAWTCLAKDLGPAKPLYAPKVRRHAWADGKCAGRPAMQTPSRTTNEGRKRARCRWST